MKFTLTITSLFFLVPVFARADVVITADGSRLTGKLLGIEKGIIKLETSYAGNLNIDQQEVTSFTTEEEVLFRVSGGETFAGKPEAVGEKGIRIQSGGAFHEVNIKTVERALPLSGDETMAGSCRVVDSCAVARRGGRRI